MSHLTRPGSRGTEWPITMLSSYWLVPSPYGSGACMHMQVLQDTLPAISGGDTASTIIACTRYRPLKTQIIAAWSVFQLCLCVPDTQYMKYHSKYARAHLSSIPAFLAADAFYLHHSITAVRGSCFVYKHGICVRPGTTTTILTTYTPSMPPTMV